MARVTLVSGQNYVIPQCEEPQSKLDSRNLHSANILTVFMTTCLESYNKNQKPLQTLSPENCVLHCKSGHATNLLVW